MTAVRKIVEEQKTGGGDDAPRSTSCRVANFVIGNNAVAVDAAGVVAERLGYSHAMISATSPEGPAEEIGRHLADMAARGALEIVAGYDKSTVAGLQAAAAVKARADALQSGIPYEQAYARALTESADAALTSAAQSYASGQQKLAANHNIAAAAQQGVAAEREAQQAAAASAQTQDALNKARATGNATLVDAADTV